MSKEIKTSAIDGDFGEIESKETVKNEEILKSTEEEVEKFDFNSDDYDDEQALERELDANEAQGDISEYEDEKYSEDYKLDGITEFIDELKGEVVDNENLTPWEKIESLAKKLDAPLEEPKKGCNNCFGRGYIGFRLVEKKVDKELNETSSTQPQKKFDRIPVPCPCVFPYEARKKQREMGIGSQLGELNRSQRRRLEKTAAATHHLLLKQENKKARRDIIAAKKKKRRKMKKHSKKLNRTK